MNKEFQYPSFAALHHVFCICWEQGHNGTLNQFCSFRVTFCDFYILCVYNFTWFWFIFMSILEHYYSGRFYVSLV